MTPKAVTKLVKTPTRLVLRWSNAPDGDGLGDAGKTRLCARWVAVPEVSAPEAPIIPLREGTRPAAIRVRAFPAAEPASAVGSAR